MVGLNANNSERYVGTTAKRQAVTNPQNTVFSSKDLWGSDLMTKVFKMMSKLCRLKLLHIPMVMLT
ncbi:MAG: hypothetical protein CM1200mP38_4580 [Dehalococcoidia bacterium]|nr:MAG: hypothetical protein CM1200mP38_4580 [Dehalococcoidia bacterium]